MNLQKQSYLSGIKSLKIALAKDMAFDDVSAGKLNSYTYTGEFYDIPFTRNTGAFSSEASIQAKGIIKEKSASIFHPGITVDILILLDQLIGQKLVVGILTNEDEFFVLGAPDQPLQLSYSYGSGKSLEDESGFEISLSGQNTISIFNSDTVFTS